MEADNIMENFMVKIEEEVEDPVFEEFCSLNTADRVLNYYIGGISKESIFEVYEKYVDRFIYKIDIVQKLLDMFKQYSRLDKVLLLDVHNEYTICGDSAPLDKSTFDFCWDVVKSTIGLVPVCYSNLKNCKEQKDKSFECTLRYERDAGTGGCHICIKSVNKYMAIVYLVDETIDVPKNFIAHNFNCICEALTKIMDLNKHNPFVLQWADTTDFEESLKRVL